MDRDRSIYTGGESEWRRMIAARQERNREEDYIHAHIQYHKVSSNVTHECLTFHPPNQMSGRLHHETNTVILIDTNPSFKLCTPALFRLA